MWINKRREWLPVDALLRDEQSVVVSEDTYEREHRGIEEYLPEWYAQAACAGEEIQTFFGKDDLSVRPSLTITEVRRAQMICLSCPVFSTCLEHALTQPEEYGIWASTTRNMRLRIRQEIESGMTTLSNIMAEIVTLRDQMVMRSAS